MRLTRRGSAVLVLAVLLLGFGFWGHFPFLRALGAIAFGAVLTAALLTARGPTVRVRRSVYPERVERGRPALATLQVGNPGRRRQPALLAVDAAGSAVRVVRVRALPPGGDAVYHYELPTDIRGRLTVGPLALHRADLFGLAHNRLPTGATATLRVHPRRLPARVLVGGHPRHHHKGATIDHALRGSVDIQDVREYVPGDEVRHLHWKATARTGRLMVRDLADPDQPRFTLVLDTRPDALGVAAFEEAVDLAASLLAASAQAGHHSRLVTPSGLDVPVAGGGPGVRRLLDELSEVSQGGRCAGVVPDRMRTSRSSGGALVVVTATGTAPASLADLRRRYSTVVVMALTGAATGSTVVSGVRVIHAAGAAEAVRRWNEVAG